MLFISVKNSCDSCCILCCIVLHFNEKAHITAHINSTIRFSRNQKTSQNRRISETARFFCLLSLVRMTGLEPAFLSEPEPKSGVSANFTTSASGITLSFMYFLLYHILLKMSIHEK